jgi:uncharacterized BrkB/YihY/UPF0761 family membrane protein
MFWKKNLVLFMPVLALLLILVIGLLIMVIGFIPNTETITNLMHQPYQTLFVFLAWIMPILALISLIFGIKEIANKKRENKELAIISIVINLLLMILSSYLIYLHYNLPNQF